MLSLFFGCFAPKASSTVRTTIIAIAQKSRARVDQQTYNNRGVNTIGALYKSHVQRHNSTKHILKIGQWKKFRISCLACQMML
jgi:hypothetical protein